jgi:hypothetical protein
VVNKIIQVFKVDSHYYYFSSLMTGLLTFFEFSWSIPIRIVSQTWWCGQFIDFSVVDSHYCRFSALMTWLIKLIGFLWSNLIIVVSRTLWRDLKFINFVWSNLITVVSRAWWRFQQNSTNFRGRFALLLFPKFWLLIDMPIVDNEISGNSNENRPSEIEEFYRP